LVNGLKKARQVSSVERGKLKFAKQDGNIVVTLPLGITDMLLIDL